MYQFKEMPKDIVFIDDDDDDSIDEGQKETPAAVNRSNQKGKVEVVSSSSALPKIINLTSGQDAYITLQQSTANTVSAPGYDIKIFYYLSRCLNYKFNYKINKKLRTQINNLTLHHIFNFRNEILIV